MNVSGTTEQHAPVPERARVHISPRGNGEKCRSTFNRRWSSAIKPITYIDSAQLVNENL